MLVRKYIVALAVAVACGAALGKASAAVVTITCVGNSNGETVQATNTFQMDLGVMHGKKKASSEHSYMMGGIIFSADGSCSTSGGPLVTVKLNPSGPSGIPCPPSDHHPGNGSPDVTNPYGDGPSGDGNCENHLPWNSNPDCPLGNVTPPTIDPSINPVTTPTPLPAAVWSGGALMAGLGALKRLGKRRTV